eukprot:m.127186 g.127186  ORF g.127186 m.127186 type:complete len:467 (-) comp22213_c0_seq1:158-1558(-)
MTMPSRALVAVAVMTMGLSMPSLSMAAVSAPDNMVGVATARDAVPRRVVVRDREFVVADTGAPIVMRGPNVVVKGPPYLPAVEGTTICNDVVDAVCTKAGNCTSCETFNQADVDHMKSLGWNAIRLGVVWAGAQPRDEDALDPAFLTRLHALLDLTDKNGIHVILDNHGDMVGSAGCGNGVPMWFQQKAAPELIGKPLVTDFPYSLIMPIDKVSGYDYCGTNATMWALHAGDPNFNLLNPCCQRMNSDNPGGLGYTTISQKTMGHLTRPGAGRDDFVRFWKLVAEAVTQHPSAVAAELMNEPMTIIRNEAFDTWRACAEVINGIIPDMSVAICDTGEGAVLPAWVDKYIGPGIAIDPATVAWIKNATTLFYAWHWYGAPANVTEAVINVQAISADWNVPTFATEFGSCEAWKAAAAANISHLYWHYSSYCTTGPSFGNRTVPSDTFGACILGWAGGGSSTCSTPST